MQAHKPMPFSGRSHRSPGMRARCVTLDDVSAIRGRGEARLGGAALATAATFLLSGVVFGTWVSRLPAIREVLGATTAELGVALLMPGFGSLLSMPYMGAACNRWGSRRIVLVFGLLATVILPVLALVRTVPELALALFLFGVGFGAWDVSMNVQGSAVEREAGRAWMPRYHAGWSVGGIAGAGLGALAARQDLDPFRHFSVAAILSAALLMAALPWFIRDDRLAQQDEPEDEGNRRGRLLNARLLAIGAVTACATCIEGAAADWLAIYLKDDRAVPDAGAAAGYMVFAIAMAAGRFLGTPTIERLGREGALRLAGLLTAVGIGVTVGAPMLAGAYAGAAIWGLGVSVIFPAAMSAGGELPGRSSEGIAVVSTIGYAGFLLGPPVIGVIADSLDMGRALLVLLVLPAAILALAPALRPRRLRPRSIDLA
jgi:predicted MFS family arabinose efflux permease